ncbi:hypothetical protein NL676_000406 [Syzygium grande]|nr:hypothetical protein NL676_000406 [Syzygium grande]
MERGGFGPEPARSNSGPGSVRTEPHGTFARQAGGLAAARRPAVEPRPDPGGSSASGGPASRDSGGALARRGPRQPDGGLRPRP